MGIFFIVLAGEQWVTGFPYTHTHTNTHIKKVENEIETNNSNGNNKWKLFLQLIYVVLVHLISNNPAASAYNECVYFDTTVGKICFFSFLFSSTPFSLCSSSMFCMFWMNLFCLVLHFCVHVCVCVRACGYEYYCAAAARFILFTLLLYEYVCFVFCSGMANVSINFCVKALKNNNNKAKRKKWQRNKKRHTHKMKRKIKTNKRRDGF